MLKLPQGQLCHNEHRKRNENKKTSLELASWENEKNPVQNL